MRGKEGVPQVYAAHIPYRRVTCESPIVTGLA